MQEESANLPAKAAGQRMSDGQLQSHRRRSAPKTKSFQCPLQWDSTQAVRQGHARGRAKPTDTDLWHAGRSRSGGAAGPNRTATVPKRASCWSSEEPRWSVTQPTGIVGMPVTPPNCC